MSEEKRCRCVVCDCGELARRGQPEEAIAIACVVAIAGVPDGPAADRTATLKESLCDKHRRGYAMMLLTGAQGLELIQQEAKS